MRSAIDCRLSASQGKSSRPCLNGIERVLVYLLDKARESWTICPLPIPRVAQRPEDTGHVLACFCPHQSLQHRKSTRGGGAALHTLPHTWFAVHEGCVPWHVFTEEVAIQNRPHKIRHRALAVVRQVHSIVRVARPARCPRSGSGCRPRSW